MVAQAFNASMWKQRKADIFEYQTSQSSIVRPCPIQTEKEKKNQGRRL